MSSRRHFLMAKKVHLKGTEKKCKIYHQKFCEVSALKKERGTALRIWLVLLEAIYSGLSRKTEITGDIYYSVMCL